MQETHDRGYPFINDRTLGGDLRCRKRTVDRTFGGIREGDLVWQHWDPMVCAPMYIVRPKDWSEIQTFIDYFGMKYAKCSAMVRSFLNCGAMRHAYKCYFWPWYEVLLWDVTYICEMKQCRLIPGFDHSCRWQQICMFLSLIHI